MFKLHSLYALLVAAAITPPISSAQVTAGIGDALAPLCIDRNHSTIGFEVPIIGGISKVTGKFTDFDVQLVWDVENLSNSSVLTTIQVASVDTGIDDRDNELRSGGFFDVAMHPTITFESNEITGNGDGYLAHGTLTIKGVSKEIALPFKVVKREKPDEGYWYAFNIEYELDRTEYDITWEHNLLKIFVGDEVVVKLFVLIC